MNIFLIIMVLVLGGFVVYAIPTIRTLKDKVYALEIAVLMLAQELDKIWKEKNVDAK